MNPEEAERVRAIFALYLEHGSLLPVVKELAQRDWDNKAWQTRKGLNCQGRRFTRTSLHKMLTNVLYIGKVRYRSEVHNGEHAAIVSEEVWRRVQSQLAKNRVSGGNECRNKFGAIFKGLIRCSACDCSMTPTHSKRGVRRYRYYVCVKAQKMGFDTCPSKSIPAAQIEELVVKRIKVIGADPQVLREVLAQGGSLDADEVRTALAEFTSVWETLSPREQARVVRLLIERVDFDGGQGRVAIAFRPTGIKTLAGELTEGATA